MTTPKRGRHVADSERPADRPKVKHVDLPPALHARLQAYQRAVSLAKTDRGDARVWVTLPEVIEQLLDLADKQARMLADALEGK